MNSRERWRAVLERKPVDRVPCDIWGTDEVFETLCKELQCADRWELSDKLEIDTMYAIKPPYVGPELEAGTTFWGIKYKEVDYGAGRYSEAVFHPLAEINTVEAMKSYQWPSADWFDYSCLKEEVEKHRHRPIRAGHVEPFMFYSAMRGLEQAMIDLVANPELVECAFDCIFDFLTRQFERILEATNGDIDLTAPAEDLGSQTGSLFSLETFRRFHKPRFKKYIELAHQAGVRAFFHTDGASRQFIGDLIEIGIDVLNPIQWRCPGMERKGLKEDFGEQVIFHGGVENQQTLPFGKPKDVRAEVIECFETLGTGGGYICAPCHNIQPITPVENILEMYDTIKEIGSDPKYTKRASAEID